MLQLRIMRGKVGLNNAQNCDDQAAECRPKWDAECCRPDLYRRFFECFLGRVIGSRYVIVKCRRRCTDFSSQQHFAGIPCMHPAVSSHDIALQYNLVDLVDITGTSVHQVVSWKCEHGLAEGHSPALVRLRGTVFLYFSETKRLPWTLLSVLSNVFSLLHTDTAHAAH